MEAKAEVGQSSEEVDSYLVHFCDTPYPHHWLPSQGLY